MDVQLDQLRALAAVVSHRTFEAAAADLGVTPSAISQRIRALESSVGRVLVDRGRPARATAAGVPLVRLARQFQLLLQEAADELAGDDVPVPSRAAVPQLTVVVNADSLATWLLPALTPFSARVGLRLIRDDEGHTTELLRDGTAAAAITSVSTAVQGCSIQPLATMRYLAVATPAFLARHLNGPGRGDPVGDGLPTAPVVVFDEKDRLQHEYLRRRCGDSARLAGPRHQVPASADFAAAVRLGLGWGLLPIAQLGEDVPAGRLVPLGGDPVDVSLYWQRWKVRSPLLEDLTEAVRAAAPHDG